MGEPNVDQTRAVTRVYALAILSEVEAAEARYRADLAAIRRRYLTDLEPADPFRMLLTATMTGGGAIVEPPYPTQGRS
jgi:hypothetical protein